MKIIMENIGLRIFLSDDILVLNIFLTDKKNNSIIRKD